LSLSGTEGMSTRAVDLPCLLHLEELVDSLLDERLPRLELDAKDLVGG